MSTHAAPTFDAAYRATLGERLAAFEGHAARTLEALEPSPDRSTRAAAVVLAVVPGGEEVSEDDFDGAAGHGGRLGDGVLTVPENGPGQLADGDPAAVLLTLRSRDLRHHSGQFALPGGRLDPGETVVEAALRELDEELGLRLGEADVLGRLDDYSTRSGFVISPVVVWGHAGSLRPEPGEVARVFRVPLGRLGAPDVPREMPGEESGRPLLALELLGTSVFAPTAAILHQFAELAVHGRVTRVSHYDQPRFAWS